MMSLSKFAWPVLLTGAMLAGCGEAEPVTAELTGPLWGADSAAVALDLRVEAQPREVVLFEEVDCVVDLWVQGARAKPAEDDSAEGDVAAGTLAVNEPVEFAPEQPEEMTGRFEAQRQDAQRGGVDGLWLRHRARLRPIALDAVMIGPFSYTDPSGETVTTPEIRIEVTPALGEDDSKTEAEAPAPFFEARAPLWPWFAGVGALMALVFGLWFWRRAAARRGLRAEPPGTALPPHVRALRALGRLRSTPRESAEEIETFYVDVSGILRVYLEERFGLRAPERTTEEFLPELERSGVLDAEQRAHLRQFLQQCDMVKFAAVRPSADVHDATFTFAEELVESTRPERMPAAASSAAAEVATP